MNHQKEGLDWDASTILPRVAIGENSVNTAGDLVINDIPKNTMLAGGPAKVIKEL